MSILNVNQIQPVGSGQTVTISATNISAGSATVTAGTFSGNLSSSGISTFSDTVNVGAGKSIRLYGATSGYSDIIAAAGSASTTFTLPANGGSASQYLQTDGSGVLSWQTVTEGLQWSENQVSLTGTAQLWTGIPSDAVQIMIVHNGWSQDASASQLIEIGDSGGLETTGYSQGQGYFGASSSGSGNTNNPNWGNSYFNAASNALTGLIVLTRVGTTNEWCCQWFFNNISGTCGFTLGNKTLSGTLDRVQIRPASGNFDAGTASLIYLT